MQEVNLPKITAARLILIRELSTGPKKWGQLELAYYGPERKAEKVSVSFYNKLKDAKALGIITHDPVNKIYTLGEVGQQLLNTIKEQGISMDVKSEAQIKWEAEHPKA